MFLRCNPDIAAKVLDGVARIWSLYALIDPRTDRVFYVGITTNPRDRVAGHRHDPASAAYYRVKDVHAAGLKCRMKIIRVYLDKHEALDHENRLIALHPGLLNKPPGPKLKVAPDPAAVEPWQAEGISRATFFGRKAKSARQARWRKTRMRLSEKLPAPALIDTCVGLTSGTD